MLPPLPLGFAVEEPPQAAAATEREARRTRRGRVAISNLFVTSRDRL
jgi:hypothetical protein